LRARPRLDANHKEVALAFEDLGCAVQSLAYLGGGVPDLLVACRGVTWVVEVKVPGAAETYQQREWAARWQGRRVIASDLDDVISIVTQMRSQAAALTARFAI
jgi:hypothetical protein